MYVVAERADGRAWLASTDELVREQRELPFYGVGTRPSRGGAPDVAVAKLAFSSATLAEVYADGAYLLQMPASGSRRASRRCPGRGVELGSGIGRHAELRQPAAR